MPELFSEEVLCVIFHLTCLSNCYVGHHAVSTLVARANVWLRRHPAVSATCLEAVEFDTDVVEYGMSVDTSSVTEHGYGHHGTFCVKVLRREPIFNAGYTALIDLTFYFFESAFAVTL